MNVKVFGQLADITTGDLQISDVDDTNGLVQKIQEQFPALSNVKYLVAVNKQVINKNTPIDEDTVVALLPPFSGG